MSEAVSMEWHGAWNKMAWNKMAWNKMAWNEARYRGKTSIGAGDAKSAFWWP